MDKIFNNPYLACDTVFHNYRTPPHLQVGPQDFVLLKVLGKGGYGKVFQVRDTD